MIARVRSLLVRLFRRPRPAPARGWRVEYGVLVRDLTEDDLRPAPRGPREPRWLDRGGARRERPRW